MTCTACNGLGRVLRLGRHVVAVPYPQGAVAVHAWREAAADPFVFLKRCMARGAEAADFAHVRTLRGLVLTAPMSPAVCPWCVVGRAYQATSAH